MSNNKELKDRFEEAVKSVQIEGGVFHLEDAFNFFTSEIASERERLVEEIENLKLEYSDSAHADDAEAYIRQKFRNHREVGFNQGLQMAVTLIKPNE